MDEITIMTEGAIQQQQLAEVQTKVEGLRTSPAKKDVALTDSKVPIDLEKTPEFEAWKQVKLQECFNYLINNWEMEITIERLLMQDEYLGYPDPRNRRAHARVASNNNYIDPATGAVAVNPATGRQMSYAIWRKIDPPTPEPTQPIT